MPEFKHDCPECRFLGHFARHDVYECAKGGIATSLIARWSDNGPDYSAVPNHMIASWIDGNPAMGDHFYHDLVEKGLVPAYHLAIIMALALEELKS